MAEVLVLVPAIKEDPWRTIVELGQRPTWVSRKPQGVTVLYCYGEENAQPYISGDCLYVRSPEGIVNLGKKTLASFKYALLFLEFSYIFRTNVSSYVHLEGLKTYLENAPKNNFYSGVIASHKGIRFISGAGYTLSRDLVQRVVDLENKWDHSLIDDVALGKLLTSCSNAELVPCPRITVSRKKDFRLIDPG